MTRDIEHIVTCHNIARARQKAGKPIWDRRIDIKRILNIDRDNTSNEHAANVANQIGALLRSRLPQHVLYGDITILEIVEGLEQLRAGSYDGEPSITPLSDLNEMLSHLYDWSDIERVWLGNGL